MAPVDFSSLVLAPAMSTFARIVTITPLKSQPNVPTYLARGIWKVDNIDIILEDGGNFSNRKITLGIRLSEFAVAPSEGDLVSTIVSELPLSYWQGDYDPFFQIVFLIDDANPDGQGGSSLVLKRQTPL